MEILAILIVTMLVFQMLEFLHHNRVVKEIPVRIHVNGSRGKSSVVRLIAAGLRYGGLKVIAKTTGTLPRIILPDGHEIAIHRHRSATIHEQVRFFRFASRYKPDVVVLECMAIQPVYQWITEHQMVHATHGVITNIRLDHIREMGPGLSQIARSISNTVPQGGKVFVGGEYGREIIREIAGKRGSELVHNSVEPPDEKEMSRFSYIEHPENVHLALEVCVSLGVSREVALQGMWQVTPDAGALKRISITVDEKNLDFLNAFAANDPQSTLKICRSYKWRDYDTVIILLNSRMDRLERTFQLIEMINRFLDPDMVIVTGIVTRRILRSFKKGLKVVDGSELPDDRVLDIIGKEVKAKGLVLLIGNMGGGGLEFIDHVLKQQDFIDKMT